MPRQLTCKAASAALLVIFITSFPFGFNGSVLNQPYEHVLNFYNETFTERRHDGTSLSSMTITVVWSLTNAIYVVGVLAGYLLGGSLMDKIGRKNVILIGQVFLIVGTALGVSCKISKSPEMLIIGRCLVGVLGGIGNSTTPIFLAEIAPTRLRGAMGVGHQLAMASGSLVSSILGLPMVLATDTTWNFLYMMNVLIFIVAIVFLPVIPDTPRYLYMVVGNEEKARSSLIWYRGRMDVDDEINEMAREKQSHLGEQPFAWRDLFAKKLRRSLTIVILLQVNRQTSAMNAISWYSANIFKGAGLAKTTIPFAVIGLSVVSVTANLIAVPLIDLVGRRVLLITTQSVMVVDLIVLVVMITIQPEHPWAAVVSIVCVYLHVMMCNQGIGAVSWVIGAELFEQRARPRAGLVAGVAYCVMFFIVVLAFEPLNKTIHQYVFLIFAGFLVFFITYTFIRVPETKNKTFAEISYNLARSRVSFVTS